MQIAKLLFAIEKPLIWQVSLVKLICLLLRIDLNIFQSAGNGITCFRHVLRFKRYESVCSFFVMSYHLIFFMIYRGANFHRLPVMYAKNCLKSHMFQNQAMEQLQTKFDLSKSTGHTKQSQEHSFLLLVDMTALPVIFSMLF